MIRRAPGRLWRNEDGTATVEFTIAFALFVMVLMIGVEAGVMLSRQAMLERGLDIAMRDLRLGSWVQPTHEQLRDRICENTAIVPACRDNLLLELAPINTDSWALPAQPPACVDREEDMAPVTTFIEGAGNQLMLVRACFVIDPIFPTTRLGLQLPLDASGGFQMIAVSSFVNEPR